LLETLINIDSQYFAFSLFAIGVLSGFVGAMGGPSGLIIIPFMLLSGFTPVLALGTARLAATVPWVIAVSKYRKAGQFRQNQFIPLTIVGLIGGVIGTYLIIDVDEKLVYPAIGVAFMIAAPLLFIKKEFGLVNIEHSALRHKIGYIAYFLVMIYGGFIGAGASMLAVFALVSFMGYKMLEAHSTHMAVWIVMSVASCAIFIWNGHVDYYYALIILVSMSVGSFIGSKIIVKKGDTWIKAIVGAFAFVVGLKMMLGYI